MTKKRIKIYISDEHQFKFVTDILNKEGFKAIHTNGEFSKTFLVISINPKGPYESGEGGVWRYSMKNSAVDGYTYDVVTDFSVSGSAFIKTLLIDEYGERERERVREAAGRGKAIEYRHIGKDVWWDCDHPIWAWETCEYRIKEEHVPVGPDIAYQKTVEQAFKAGKIIERKNNGESTWQPVDAPGWYWSESTYRVKPEENVTEITVTVTSDNYKDTPEYRDMLYKAHKAGKQIQRLWKDCTKWEDIDTPHWNWGLTKYRIKPEDTTAPVPVTTTKMKSKKIAVRIGKDEVLGNIIHDLFVKMNGVAAKPTIVATSIKNWGDQTLLACCPYGSGAEISAGATAHGYDVLNGATDMGKIIAYLSQPEEIKVKNDHGDEYTAVFGKHTVQFGCATIDNEVFEIAHKLFSLKCASSSKIPDQTGIRIGRALFSPELIKSIVNHPHFGKGST